MINKYKNYTEDNAALDYEALLGTLLENEAPDFKIGWMNPGEFGRGAMGGLVDADVFRAGYKRAGERDLDVGIILTLLLLTKKVEYLEYKIKELERRQ